MEDLYCAGGSEIITGLWSLGSHLATVVVPWMHVYTILADDETLVLDLAASPHPSLTHAYLKPLVSFKEVHSNSLFSLS